MKTVTNPCDGENRPAILLVGASVRWAAQSLRRGQPNSRLIGLDWFGDSDTRMVCDRFHAFQSDQEPSRNLSEQIDSVANLHAARVVHVGGLQVAGAANPWEGWNRLRSLVCKLAIESGVDEFPVTIPLTYQCSAGRGCLAGAAGEDAPLADWVDGASGRSIDWLWKQIGSTGGLGIRRVLPEDLSIATSGDGWLQQRVHGRSYGLVAIAESDQTRVLGLSRGLHHRSGDRPFVYSGSRGPIFEGGGADPGNVPWRSLQVLSERVAREFSLRGLFNLDFIRDSAGRWWLLELNPRPSASCEIIERWATEAGWLSPDHSLMRMHLDAIDGRDQTDLLACRSSSEWLHGRNASAQWVKRIVFANRDVLVDVEKIQKQFRADSIAVELADLPSSSTAFVKAGEPILTVLLRKDDRAKRMAAAQLRRAIRIVQGAR
ncbi:ATP-grasp domain-containing protein [Rhodopirellula islandica]|uniref:ATP-grasp domain-containing protein n=1 Tax=Rhodopirellula islandica TaxID=595434 RepID=UPI001F02A732|nr:ATP-grasp domain-containing protein [Rhodopirellula islandica]